MGAVEFRDDAVSSLSIIRQTVGNKFIFKDTNFL